MKVQRNIYRLENHFITHEACFGLKNLEWKRGILWREPDMYSQRFHLLEASWLYSKKRANTLTPVKGAQQTHRLAGS